MVLNGTIETYDNGESTLFRGTWTPNPDGTVRQLFEIRNKDYPDYDVWFDGRYEPVKQE